MYVTWIITVSAVLMGLLMIIFRRPIARKLANSKRFFLLYKLYTILACVLVSALGVYYICLYHDNPSRWWLGLAFIGLGVYSVIFRNREKKKLTSKTAIENFARRGFLRSGIYLIIAMVLVHVMMFFLYRAMP